MRTHQFRPFPLDALIPYARNARTHSPAQVDQLAASIERFGFTNPCLVSPSGELIAGHGRVLAARKLGMHEVPCVVIEGLSAEERAALVLADNKLALNAGWDDELLKLELSRLKAADELANIDVSITGFTAKEVDEILEGVVAPTRTVAFKAKTTLPGHCSKCGQKLPDGHDEG